MNTEIKILPIFDQRAPGVWSDFWHIKSEAWFSVYKYRPNEEDKANSLNEYDTESKGRAYTFAFGAYANNKMVGYIRGTCKASNVRVHDLYVLPRFHRKRIGKRLMNATEDAFKSTHRYIKLLAMETSDPFYIKQNFSSPTRDGNYVKKMSRSGIYGAVPVFKYCSKTWTECTEFAAKYNITLDKDTVDKFHTPIFVYRGDNNAIEGLAIINPVENNAQITADTSWTNRSLTRTAERYLQHMAQKNNKTR